MTYKNNPSSVDKRGSNHSKPIGWKPEHEPGPARSYTPEEIRAMGNDPTKPLPAATPKQQPRNVTDELVIISSTPRDMTWDEMAEEGRKIANQDLWFIKIEAEDARKALRCLDDVTWTRFKELMAVIKQNRVEERQQGNGDTPTAPTPEQLMKKGLRI